ncbi:hypothetical protein OTSGILL_0217 [Orientia tsutsugamushi str. Gilliam]|uniref:Uncharacterized protein n=1 Tax=Orientia tsutsugamushi str. Gilliam TaxID=1359184 RepID=A0A0F3MEU3_ORITS|nr:hypothetical protein OTSGILL_0217 [Orientia tsutsugamushi str. Gilliam]
MKHGKPIIRQLIVGKRGLRKQMTLSRKTELITECIGIYMLIRNDANLRLVIYPK